MNIKFRIISIFLFIFLISSFFCTAYSVTLTKKEMKLLKKQEHIKRKNLFWRGNVKEKFEIKKVVDKYKKLKTKKKGLL